MLDNSEILNVYHKWSYNNADLTWQGVRWLGIQILKTPWDLWSYQQIICETRPDILIETGTFYGGSALYFASIFELLNHGRVITIDIEHRQIMSQHDRITYLLGSSTSEKIIESIKENIKPGENVMVVLDSDHQKDHVLNELRLYSKFVTPGDYLVVEDTNINGHPVCDDFGPGPMEALEEFMKEDECFVSDEMAEMCGVSYFPKGWLLKVK
jgi:cephalosporin hydroxylase